MTTLGYWTVAMMNLQELWRMRKGGLQQDILEEEKVISMDWISTNIISESYLDHICNRTFLNIELYIYLVGSCNRVVRHKLATTISSSCLGYKAKFIHSWPWNSFNKCCQAIRDDPECSGKFFVYPVTGSCVCEKIGEECPRQFGFSTELHLM